MNEPLKYDQYGVQFNFQLSSLFSFHGLQVIKFSIVHRETTILLQQRNEGAI